MTNPTEPSALERAFRAELTALRQARQFAEISDAEFELLCELFRLLISSQMPPDVEELLNWFERTET